MRAFYDGRKWFEAGYVRGGAIPIATVIREINLADVDTINIVSGLCSPGWGQQLEEAGFRRVSQHTAMNPDWNQGTWVRG